MGDVLVELGEFLLCYFILRPAPNGLHRVESFVFFVTLLALRLHLDWIRDEVGVVPDDVLEDPLRGVILNAVLLVYWAKVEGHRGAVGGAFRVL